MRKWILFAGAAVLGGGLLTGVGPATADTGALPSAHVWVTTPDGSQKMADDGRIAFHAGGSANLTVTVDPSRTYQRFDGAGASITDSSASVLYRLDPQQRAATMRDLFSTDGLDVLRQPMGASDFVDGPFYTYDDQPAGSTDYGMRHFSVEHDLAQIIPLLRQARALNPNLKIIATPWSPPAWMKTPASLIGGRLIDDPRIYDAYALYFVKFVQAYQRAGVPIYALTLQNEPQNRNPNRYPGMDMPVAQEAKLINALGPALQRAGLHTKLFGYDHNWNEHPNDIASTPPGEDPEVNYPFDLMATSAGHWLAGTAFHCYFGDQTRQTDMHKAFPDKAIWFTECSGSHGPTDPPAQVFSDTLKWHARNLVLGVTRNWGQTVVNWNLALDPSGGPHNNGCDTCTGVVTVGPGQTVTRDAEYYTLGHLARFVRPGAVRIASTSFGTTGWNGQIMDVAFRNPDGSTVLVAHNENDDPRSVAIAEGNASFDYTLPGGALATFVWPPSRALDNGQRLLPVDGTTATASDNPSRRCQRDRRRREHAVDHCGGASARADIAGRPRRQDAGPLARPRHRPGRGRLSARLRGFHQRRRVNLVGPGDRQWHRAVDADRASGRRVPVPARRLDGERPPVVERGRPPRLPLTQDPLGRADLDERGEELQHAQRVGVTGVVRSGAGVSRQQDPHSGVGGRNRRRQDAALGRDARDHQRVSAVHSPRHLRAPLAEGRRVQRLTGVRGEVIDERVQRAVRWRQGKRPPLVVVAPRRNGPRRRQEPGERRPRAECADQLVDWPDHLVESRSEPIACPIGKDVLHVDDREVRAHTGSAS